MNIKSTFASIQRGLELSSLFGESSAFIALAEAATTSRTAEAWLRKHIEEVESQVHPGALDREYVLAVRLEMLQLKKRGQELLKAINSLSQEEQALFSQSIANVQKRLSLLVTKLAALESFPDIAGTEDNPDADNDSSSAEAPGEQKAEQNTGTVEESA